MAPDCVLRLGRGLTAAALILGMASVAAAAPTPSSTVSDREIQAAVDRGVRYLLQTLPANSGGRASLMVLALLKAGVPPEKPELKAAIERIAARVTAEGTFLVSGDHNYDAGVTLMALANADPKKFKPQITVLTRYLISNQNPDGDWDYPVGNPHRGTGDTSITQYAVLGLWDATRAGVEVPTRVWDNVARWHISRQQRDGGFAYHPRPGGMESSHTMTVAGVGSLLVARLHLFGAAADQSDLDETPAARKKRGKKFGFLTPSYGDEEEVEAETPAEPAGTPAIRLSALDKSVAGGRKWLSDRFAIDPGSPWKLYYLYGIERLTALANLREIAGHDWYEEGAALLLQSQGATGAWGDSSGDGPATSFGVMFLVKATAKALNRARQRDPRFGGGLLVGGRGLPENLENIQLDQGGVKVRKLKGAVDELLAELENAGSQKVESAQSALVERISTENPEALLGQTDRLLKLARDRRPEVRRTAFWGLGRSNDLRTAPTLIEGLSDADLSCMVEARNALRYLSRRIDFIDLPDEPSDAQRAQAIAEWKKWYQTVRPYDERDDLEESTRP